MEKQAKEEKKQVEKEINQLKKKADDIEQIASDELKKAEDFSFKPDKQKHFFVGALMGLVFSRFGFIGLLVGWGIVIGWELYQGWSHTGTMEFADIVYGGIALTFVWLIGTLFFRRRR